VTRLTFADSSFDLMITNDVLEHVPSYEDAYRELFRVLAPGGLLVFTVPFRSEPGRAPDRARVTPSGAVEHLLPPEYHGRRPREVCSATRSLVGASWRAAAVGFAKTGALLYWSLIHGLLGPDQCVFFAVKP